MKEEKFKLIGLDIVKRIEEIEHKVKVNSNTYQKLVAENKSLGQEKGDLQIKLRNLFKK